MKHKTRTKALSWLLSFALVLGLMPEMSLTAWAAETSLNGISANYTAQDGETLAGNLVGNHKISIAAGATVTLKGATISLGSGADYAGITCVGSATIVLEGENSVMGGICDDMGQYPGIYVPDGSTLTIQGTGSLSASSNTNAQYGGMAAGIGGGYLLACGNIVIAGGTITATGGDMSAAIGGGPLGNCGNITVEAGTVTANGGIYAAAIGSGYGATCGNISITGGKVTATGGENGAGIGSGWGHNDDNSISISECGNITISGGEVEATGGMNGAGIGSGNEDRQTEQLSKCGAITISGGNVTANGGSMGAGIGSGAVNLIGDTGDYCGAITISGGNVTANGGSNGAGIGSGGQNSCKDISVSGGTVTATGGDNGAGIGSGTVGFCGAIIINQGEVEATGGTQGAGIGSGAYGSCTSVTIQDTVTKVTATKGEGAPNSIGVSLVDANVGSSCGTVTIGGTVYWNGEDYQNDGAETITKSPYSYPKNHTFTNYALGTTNAVNDTITATCTDKSHHADGQDFVGTLTISAPTKGGGAATLSGDKTAFGVADKDIRYFTKSGSEWTGETSQAPSGSGFYRASITVTDSTDTTKTYTAAVTYGVNAITTDKTYTEANDHGTVAVPPVATANAAVTINTAPDTGYELKSLAVAKAEGGGAVSVTKDGNVGSFIMPEENVIVSAEFQKANYSISFSEMAHGTAAASKDGNPVSAANPANYQDEITLTATPDSDDYILRAFTVKDASDNAVTVTDNKFTMPASNVTVSATFEQKKSASVKLVVTGSDGTSCKASLMKDSYETVESFDTMREGDKFILSVSIDADYDYSITFDPASDIIQSIKEFSNEEYQSYIEYAKKHQITVTAQTDLFWVTMPCVEGGSLTMNLTFAKAHTFTVLYQPEGSPEAVWCRFTTKVKNEDKDFAVKLNRDAAIGDAAVWSAKVTAAFDPTKTAFAATMAELETVQMQDAVVSQTAANWNDISGGKYLIIGGNAKTVVAAFVIDASAAAFYDSEELEFTVGTNADGVKYQIAVCGTDNDGKVITNGTVKAPAAPTKEGYDFSGWRVLEGTASNKTEKVYAASAAINVSENTTFNAVWKPVTLYAALNPNNGTGAVNQSVTYGDKLAIPENPAKENFALDGWRVKKAVVESGSFFGKGARFDLDTPITSNLGLGAQWEHVHYYTWYQISDFGDALSDYQSYGSELHVGVCGCYDIVFEPHSFNSNGKCACGYTKPAQEVTLKVSYGTWNGTSYTQKMEEPDRKAVKGQEVSVYAPDSLGANMVFSKWQYSTTNGDKWDDLSAYLNASFIIPRDMQVRALYVNPFAEPQVELSARSYETEAQGYLWESVLFQMNYRLPDGYTFVDAGIRMGDNNGISYYEMKEVRHSAGEKAAMAGFSLGWSFVPFVDGGGIVDYLTDEITGAISGDDPEYYYEKRENSVLDEITAATLSEYMMNNKPVNVEKYPPVYWGSQVQVKSPCGSVNTLTPLSFIQKNNGRHYIYGMAYLTYKNNGQTKTIYTEAIPVTRDEVPDYTVRATPNGMTNTKQA